MQDLNSLAISIVGGAIATVLGGLFLKAISNMKFPKISLVLIAKLFFLAFVFLLLTSVGFSLSLQTFFNYFDRSIYPDAAASSAVLVSQLFTTIATMILVGIASRLFRTPDK